MVMVGRGGGGGGGGCGGCGGAAPGVAAEGAVAPAAGSGAPKRKERALAAVELLRDLKGLKDSGVVDTPEFKRLKRDILEEE